jgi:ABC-type branched-subunit amino acid transport system ATPase component
MEGLISRSKVVLRMNVMTFTYPAEDKPTIMDVSLTVTQVSRVAVIAANGAGNSTAMKVLVGEKTYGRCHLEGCMLTHGLCRTACLPPLGEAHEGVWRGRRYSEGVDEESRLRLPRWPRPRSQIG